MDRSSLSTAAPAATPLLSLADLEPPKPQFHPKSQETLSQGSSDYSSNSGDLLPDEEEELSMRARMARELVETITTETGNHWNHLYSAVVQTLSRFPVQNSPRLTQSKTSKKTPQGNLDAPATTPMKGTSEVLGSTHRRAFSFLPGDDIPVYRPSEKGLGREDQHDAML